MLREALAEIRLRGFEGTVEVGKTEGLPDGVLFRGRRPHQVATPTTVAIAVPYIIIFLLLRLAAAML